MTLGKFVIVYDSELKPKLHWNS